MDGLMYTDESPLRIGAVIIEVNTVSIVVVDASNVLVVTSEVITLLQVSVDPFSLQVVTKKLVLILVAVMEDVTMVEATLIVLLEMVETRSVNPVRLEKNPFLTEMVEAVTEDTQIASVGTS